MEPVDIRKLLKSFTDSNLEKYGDHAYTVGYFEAMVGSLLERMPKEEKDVWVSILSKKIGEKK